MVSIDDFKAGPMPLRDLVNNSRPTKYKEFQTFLKVLEVYGSGYDRDQEEP
jgi:hypothetical protein